MLQISYKIYVYEKHTINIGMHTDNDVVPTTSNEAKHKGSD